MSKRRSAKTVTLKELEVAWWSIYDGYENIKNEDYRDYRTRIAFEELLKQCGWTVREWNEEVDKARLT